MAELKFIPLHEPELRGNEAVYLQECVSTGWVSSVGSFVTRFEAELAKVAGTKYAIAVASGTAALHLSLLVAGIGAQDEVLAPSLTFIAPINAIRYCGAHPVFIDSERDTLGMSPAALRDWLDQHAERRGSQVFNRTTGRRIALCLPVHIFGHPVRIEDIVGVCTEYGIPVLEDASESLGSLSNGKPTGSFGLAGCFSFNGNKTITTGGGGAIVTDDREFARKARHLSTQAKVDELEYIHDEIGYNYRLTNIQAALGVAQVERLADMLARKREIAERYMALLSDCEGVSIFREQSWARSNYWLNTIFMPSERKMEFVRFAQERRIQCRPVWDLIHRQRMYTSEIADPLNAAINIHSTAVSIPSSATLTDADQDRVVGAIREFVESRCTAPSTAV